MRAELPAGSSTSRLPALGRHARWSRRADL